MTIMLNSLAAFAIVGLVNDIFKIQARRSARTADVGNAALPVFFGRDGNLGIFIAFAMVPLAYFLIYRTTLGFEIRTVGANPRRALRRHEPAPPDHPHAQPVRAVRRLAGGIEILSLGYYPAVFGTTIGFAGITVALLGRSHPVGIALAALLLGGMSAGAPQMQIEADIPIEIIDVIQGLILLFLAAEVVIRRLLRVRAETVAPEVYPDGVDELRPGAPPDGFLPAPLLGFVFQIVGYLIDAILNTNLAPQTLALAADRARCDVRRDERAQRHRQHRHRGMMLTAAFVGFMVAIVVDEAMPDAQPSAIFGFTPALLVGVLAAIGAGMLVSVLHAWLSISVSADQIISGTVINIIALGLTGYLNRLIRPSGSAGSFSSFDPPEALVDLPIVGWLFNMFLSQGPITMSVIVIVIILQVLLFRSRWGLRTRAVGEHPRAADTVGVNVIALRYRNVILGGIFAGLAGMADPRVQRLVPERHDRQPRVHRAGGGHLRTLDADRRVRWRAPVHVLGGARHRHPLQPPPGDLGVWLSGIQASYPSLYNNSFSALPYILTIIVLAGVVGRSVAPAAVGQPYVKEGAH